MDDKDLQYGDSSLRVREAMTSRYKTEMNKGATNNGTRLYELINKVPNWDTYLTPKQCECAKRYTTCMNANEVDYQLNLKFGTTQQRLFGSGKSSRGAIGRLEEVYAKLKNNGYYDRLEKKRETIKTPTVTRASVTEEELKQVKELISLVISMPDFEKYLSKDQTEKLRQFMAFRNFGLTAKYFSIKESTIKETLLGNSENGILSKLQKAAKQSMVNAWEDI